MSWRSTGATTDDFSSAFMRGFNEGYNRTSRGSSQQNALGCTTVVKGIVGVAAAVAGIVAFVFAIRAIMGASSGVTFGKALLVPAVLSVGMGVIGIIDAIGNKTSMSSAIINIAVGISFIALSIIGMMSILRGPTMGWIYMASIPICCILGSVGLCMTAAISNRDF